MVISQSLDCWRKLENLKETIDTRTQTQRERPDSNPQPPCCTYPCTTMPSWYKYSLTSHINHGEDNCNIKLKKQHLYFSGVGYTVMPHWLHVKYKLCSATASWTFRLSKCSTTPTEPKTDLSGDSCGWLRPMGEQAIIEMFIGHLAQNGGKLFEITKEIIILDLNSHNTTGRSCAGGTHTHTVVI